MRLQNDNLRYLRYYYFTNTDIHIIFTRSVSSESNLKFQLYISTDLSDWTLTSWQNFNSKSIYNRYIYKELCCNCWGRILLKKDCFTRKSSCNLKGVFELPLYLYRIIVLNKKFLIMRIQIPFDFQIWDIGGAGAMQGSMLDKYAFGAHAILLVYDVTNGASFDQLAGISIVFLTIKWFFFRYKLIVPKNNNSDFQIFFRVANGREKCSIIQHPR